LRDVQISQALDYPTLDVQIDRERAGQLGVTVDVVAKSIVACTSSSALTTPNYWTSPTTGVPYRVAVRVPRTRSARRGSAHLPVNARRRAATIGQRHRHGDAGRNARRDRPLEQSTHAQRHRQRRRP